MFGINSKLKKNKKMFRFLGSHMTEKDAFQKCPPFRVCISIGGWEERDTGWGEGYNFSYKIKIIKIFFVHYF